MKTKLAPTIHLLAATLFLCLAASGSAQHLRPGRPSLPPVALDRAMGGQEAIDALAGQFSGIARHHGLSDERLAERLRKDRDLRVDRMGRLFFADSHAPDPALAPAPSGEFAQAAALVPLDQTFLLHSRPSATKKILLDFDGHTTVNKSWTDSKDGDKTFVTPPYDFDGNTAVFASTELQRIQYIWQRVAEDFAPFDVDVITEDPGVDGLQKTSAGDVHYGIRVCIGGASTDWYSNSGYGGVAYIGSFDWSSDTPCYVWENNLGNGNEKNVAEAVSHEVGHALDLYHDGTSTTGYYQGHGTGADGWAPIMGVGYYKPVVQFSRGQYADANNTEDDLVKITASYNIPYIPDDYGDIFATAAVLASGTFYADGLIERNTDVDLFRFDAGAGNFSINVDVDSRSPNLNVEATLFDALGVVVVISSPIDTLAASVSLSGMPAGTYYLKIDGVGAGNPLNTGYSDYGSIGTYAVSGTVPASGAPVAVATATPTSGLAPLTVQLSSLGSYDPDGIITAFAWSLGNGQTSIDPNPSTVYLTPGSYSAVVTVTDDDGQSSSSTVVINVLDVPPAAPTSLVASAAGSSRVDLSWVDASSNETGFQIERSTDGLNWSQIGTVGAGAESYSDTTVTGDLTYSYRVRATNPYGDSPYSNVALVTTPQSPPAAPSSLSARSVSRTQIKLTWRDNANHEQGFYVERSLNGTSWTPIATLGANVASFSNTGLTPLTTYYFRVQAYNAGGVSAYSNTSSARTKR